MCFGASKFAEERINSAHLIDITAPKRMSRFSLIQIASIQRIKGTTTQFTVHTTWLSKRLTLAKKPKVRRNTLEQLLPGRFIHFVPIKCKTLQEKFRNLLLQRSVVGVCTEFRPEGVSWHCSAQAVLEDCGPLAFSGALTFQQYCSLK